MRKPPKVGYYLDKLQKGFVCVCIAATVYGLSLFAYKGYRYAIDVRPQIQQLKEAENRKLLDEGSSDVL